MQYDLLVQRCLEHLDSINLTVTSERVENVLSEMILENMIYRVSCDDDFKVGLV